MKKIMFSDVFGLTQAVLDGRKTMTRRVCSFTLHEGNIRDELTEVFPDRVYLDGDVWMFSYKGKEYRLPKENYPKYKVGEVVAALIDKVSGEGVWNSNPWVFAYEFELID